MCTRTRTDRKTHSKNRQQYCAGYYTGKSRTQGRQVLLQTISKDRKNIQTLFEEMIRIHGYTDSRRAGDYAG